MGCIGICGGCVLLLLLLLLLLLQQQQQQQTAEGECCTRQKRAMLSQNFIHALCNRRLQLACSMQDVGCSISSMNVVHRLGTMRLRCS